MAALEVFMGWQDSIVRENGYATGEWSPDAGAGERVGLQLPDHPLVRAVFNAFMAAGPSALDNGWRLGLQDALNTQRVGAGQICLRLEAASAQDAARAVTTVSPLILDVLALLLDCSGPGRGARVIRTTDVMQAKGSCRWGDERRALAQRVAQEFQVLRRLSLPAGPLLFDLTPLGADHEAFVYQPAAWLQTAAASAPRRELQARLLQLDHRANRGPDVLAKKLGIYFSLFATEAAPSVRSVAAVLKAIGAGGADLASRGGRGGRLAERFDEALLRLAEQDLFVVRYRGGDAPGGSEDRGKGRVKRWIASELVITRARNASGWDGQRYRRGAALS